MPRSTRRRRPSRPLSALRAFLATETAGAALLAAAAVVALVWANSPWSGAYGSLWDTHLPLRIPGAHLDLDLRAWIGDGAMAIFFFVVGLEIKREMSSGHLSTLRKAALPVVAAVGGMAVPALLYLAIAGSTAPRGWAVPMATDIALAVGILAVAGGRLPSSLRALLLGLAVVDDVGAIAVIAVAYSDGVGWVWLLVAVAAVSTAVLARRWGAHSAVLHLGIGIVLWFALHEAGVHPTLGGVMMGLTVPAASRPGIPGVERFQHVLHPVSSFVVVPVFALANCGLAVTWPALRDAAGSPVAWGIVAGLVCGKPLGIVLATRLATRAGLADPPPGATRSSIAGVGAAAGIGFTVSLFITELAFDDPAQQATAKLAILVASLVSAAFATVLLRLRADPPPA